MTTKFKLISKICSLLFFALSIVNVNGQDLDVNGVLSIEGIDAISKNSTTVLEFGANGTGVINYFPGRMGIGTTAIGSTIDLGIAGGSDTKLSLMGTAQNQIDFDQGINTGYIKMIGDYMEFRNNNGDIEFTKSNLGEPHMIIKNDGKVGIGTDEPTESMEVSGTAKVSTGISIGSSTTSIGSDQAIQINDGKNIEFAIGSSSSEIRWLEGSAERAFIRSSGTQGNLDIESNASFIDIDAKTFIDFQIDDVFEMRLDNSGNLGIGTTTPSQKLEVNGVININSDFSTALQIDGKEAIWMDAGSDRISWGFGGEYNFFFDEVRIGGSGAAVPTYQLEVVGDADITGELTAASDMRLKEDISDVNDAISTVKKLRPKTYQFRTEEYPTMDLAEGQKMGFLAQDLEEVLPELVSTGAEVTSTSGETFNSKSVNYIELIPLLTKALQEQQAIIEDLRKEVEELKKK